MHRSVGSILASTLALTLLLGVSAPTRAETVTDDQWSVGTSAWMLANLVPDPPQFYYLEIGRRIAPRDGLVVAAMTWRYRSPLGIPVWASASDADEYPGFVRSVGVGLGWHHDLYRGLNASVHSFHLLQRYHEDDQSHSTGYQLLLETRLGWRWSPRASGFWIEPSLGFNWWPVEVGRPASFVAADDRWPSYFLFDPWLNLGWQW